jgi:hypothetical protein
MITMVDAARNESVEAGGQSQISNKGKDGRVIQHRRHVDRRMKRDGKASRATRHGKHVGYWSK